MIAFSLIGISTNLNNGFLTRLSEEERKIYSFRLYDREIFYREGDCFLKPDQTTDSFKEECLSGKSLIWGDSHAAALSYGMRKIKNFSQLTASSCPPFINQYFDGSPFCLDINNKVLEYIKKGLFKEIYLHSNWSGYGIKRINMLSETIEEILLIDPSITIKIVGGVPQWKPTLPDVLLKKGISMSINDNTKLIANSEFSKVETLDKEIIRLLSSYMENQNVEFISLLNKLCEDESCLAIIKDCGFTEPTAWGYGHLTANGSKLAARLIFNESVFDSSQCSDSL